MGIWFDRAFRWRSVREWLEVVFPWLSDYGLGEKKASIITVFSTSATGQNIGVLHLGMLIASGSRRMHQAGDSFSISDSARFVNGNDTYQLPLFLAYR